MVVIPLLLVGCNSDEKDDEKVDTNTNSDEPVEVVVEILTPEKLAVNEKVELQAKVTQKNEAVNDAELKFEVWESGFRDKGQMIEGKLDNDGVYKAEFTFDHDGVYYMYAHTTARGMHVMPKQKLTVGNPDMSKVVEDNSSDTMENHGDMNQNSSSHNHNSDSNENNESHNHDNSSSTEQNGHSHN